MPKLQDFGKSVDSANWKTLAGGPLGSCHLSVLREIEIKENLVLVTFFLFEETFMQINLHFLFVSFSFFCKLKKSCLSLTIH